MSNYNGAVFFDFDGTLADEQLKLYKPTSKTLYAADALKQNGYLVGIATGRSKCYIPETGIDFDCFVTTNGSYAEVHEDEIFNDFLEQDFLESLTDHLTAREIGFILEEQQRCFCSEVGRDDFMKMIEVFNIDTSCFFPLKTINGLRINKLMIAYNDAKKYAELIDKFGGEFLITRHRSNPSGDVVKRGINKATGIDKVAQHFGLERKNIFAFGDGENDFEMLEYAGVGIAMEKHAAALDEVADRVTDSVADDGIYNDLVRLKLIDPE